MAIRKVLRMGHPILRKKARELKEKEIASPEIQRLIDDMIDTMRDYDGVGLAAPQVGESVRISVIEFSEDNPRYKDAGASGLEVYINPKITVTNPEQRGYWEGCLSVPGMRGLVHRPRGVRVEYLNRDGKKKSIETEGFLSTVFQHEFDHLDGILYIDRVQNSPGSTALAFNEEYVKFLTPEEDSEIGELDD